MVALLGTRRQAFSRPVQREVSRQRHCHCSASLAMNLAPRSSPLADNGFEVKCHGLQMELRVYRFAPSGAPEQEEVEVVGGDHDV